jgi:hypothetical protein
MTAMTNAFSYGFLNYSMTKDAQNLDCAANDLKNFVSEHQPVVIRVHSSLVL